MSDQPTSILPGMSELGSRPTPPKTRPTRRTLAWNGGTDLGLLILRFAVGGTFVAHGMQKVFGMWGGPGIPGVTRMLEGFGFQQAPTLAWVLGVTELVAGGFVVLGVLTPLAAAGLAGTMINVILLKWGNGFFLGPGPGGFELELVLGASAAALALTGPGRVALDNGRTWHRRPGPWGVLSLVIGIGAGLLVFFLLRSPALPVTPLPR